MAKVERYYVVSSDEFKALNECSKSAKFKSEPVRGGGWRQPSYCTNNEELPYSEYNKTDFGGSKRPQFSIRENEPRQEADDLTTTIFNALAPEFRSFSQIILQILSQLPGFYINPHDLTVGIGGKAIPNSNIIEMLYGLLDRKLSPDLIPGCKFCLLVLSRMKQKNSIHFLSPKAIRILLKYRKDNIKKHK